MHEFPKYVSNIKMNIFLVVFLLCAEKFYIVKGQDCSFNQDVIYINDTTVGVEIASIIIPSTAQYESFYVQDTGSAVDINAAKNYFEFEKVGDTNLSFKTTNDFQHIGNDADSNGDILFVMTLYVSLKCENSTPVQTPLLLAISCTFNNKPTFSLQSYSYSLPIPIMQKTDFTVYGNEITISDSNFANTNMTLIIEPNDFKVTASKIDNKNFKAVFSAKKILQFVGEQTYTLTAENTGSKKSEVKITIGVDSETSLDSPSFKESYYYFDYDGETSMTPSNGDIEIISNKVNRANYKLDGEYADNFLINLDNNSNILSLSSVKTLPLDVPTQILLSLSFTTDSVAKATLLINIASVIPKFSNNYYSGTYDADSNEITWEEEIDIKDAASVEIKKSTLFSINETSYKITPIRPLFKSDFDKNLNIIFTVVAKSSSSNYSEAVVVISLKSDTLSALKFNSTYYTATYEKENSKWVVNLNSDIGFLEISDFSDIVIQVDKLYNANFELELESLKWKVKILSPLTNDILNNNKKLAIPLTASKTGLNITTAVLILALPDKIEIEFESFYYFATYVQGSETKKDTVELNNGIALSRNNVDDVTIIVEGYEDTFEIFLNSNTSTYQIIVIKNLNSTILSYGDILPLKLIASTTDNRSSVDSVLLLKLPETTYSFYFKDQHYEGIYNLGSNGEKDYVNLTNNIKIVDADDVELEFTYEGFEPNFQLEYDNKSSLYQITVLKNLDSSILKSKTTLIFTLTATARNNTTYSSNTVLVITLPQNNQTVSFTRPYYSGIYRVVESKGVVTLDEEIQIVDGNNVDVSFFIEEFQDYLQVEPNTGSNYTIRVIQDLNSTVLNNKSPLLIAIFARAASTIFTTTLVLELPDKSLQLEFEKPFYLATYSVDDKNTGKVVLNDDSINIAKTDGLEVHFLFEGYDNNFILTEGSINNSYTITVKNPLNDTLNSQLLILITAFNTDSQISAHTVVILNLPIMEVFSKDHYIAEYQLSSDGQNYEIIFDGEAIKLISTVFTQIRFTGYDNNFNATCIPTNECSITVENSLDTAILNSNDELVINLVAINENQSSTETSVLILKLPSKSFSFSMQYYSGEYLIQSSDSEMAKIIIPEISFENVDSANVGITLGEYKEYFKFNLDSSKWNLDISKNLDADVLKEKTELIIPLTATRNDVDGYYIANATLNIKLPTQLTVTFDKTQYSAEYIINNSGKAEVILNQDSTIDVNDSNNIQIVFDSFTDYFSLKLIESKWIVNVKKNLDSTNLTQYSELKLVMTITKVSVSYGKASLIIKLPNFSFEKDIYSGSYCVDDTSKGSINNVGDIIIDNIDTSLIEVTLTEYSEYFSIKPSEGKWTIEIYKNLSPSILSQQNTLVTSLVAVRISDKNILAKSTLKISLPNFTNVPEFEKFTYYGTYQNSDNPVVVLKEKISLTNDSVAANKMYIDPNDEYAKYFNLSQDLSISVIYPLTDEILDNVTSIALTLIAKSKEGSFGYAALIITLPKKLRDSSVKVQNQQVLFTGTYQDGSFKSPSITLNTNATSDDDISVLISNDLGLENTHFSYVYANQVLTITISELPENFLKSNHVLPLKLAIKDKNTQDTVFAVLNVELSNKADDDSGDSSKTVRTSLIIAVSILTILLLLLLVAGFLFWYFKIRENQGVEISSDEVLVPTKTKTYTKNQSKKQNLVSNVLRRPTGIAIGLNHIAQDESLTDVDPSTSVETEVEKKVAFNEDVETIENNDDEDNFDSEGLQSVTDRRPTKFVFGYPLELGVLNLSENLEENKNTPEYINTENINTKSTDFSNGIKKKGVAFDQNVERIDIEAEDQESDSENAEKFSTENNLET